MYVFHCVIAVEFNLIIELQTDSFRVLHAVDGLNVKHELR